MNPVVEHAARLSLGTLGIRGGAHNHHAVQRNFFPVFGGFAAIPPSPDVSPSADAPPARRRSSQLSRFAACDDAQDVRGSAGFHAADPSLKCPEVQYVVDFIQSSSRGVGLRRPSRRLEEVLEE